MTDAMKGAPASAAAALPKVLPPAPPEEFAALGIQALSLGDGNLSNAAHNAAPQIVAEVGEGEEELGRPLSPPPPVVSPGGAPPQVISPTHSLRINCRVSGQLEELEALHLALSWPPGKVHIRPLPELKAAKERHTLVVRRGWRGEADFVLHSLFGIQPSMAADGRAAVDEEGWRGFEQRQRRAFAPNEFRYATPAGTKHWVMWYSQGPPALGDEEINADIRKDIRRRTGHNDYSYIFYLNPKMSIPQIYHVQVFWVDHRATSQRK